MKIFLALFLCLGLITGGVGFDQGFTGWKDLLIVIAIHIGGIAFVVFAYVMAKKQESGTFLGASPLLWPVGCAIAYVVGLVSPMFYGL